jgi:hypothetical protein
LGSVVGPHPFPRIVRDFQSVIGSETIEQSRTQLGRLPDTVVACVGGGSNAAGMFYPFVEHNEVTLVGVEAGGRSDKPGDHASPLTYGQPGVLHGSYSYVMQDVDGQTCDVHSMSAGLDYPGVGPEHSYWKDAGRVAYTNCRDADAMAAFDALARSEGILPALESSHAVAQAMKLAEAKSKDHVIVVCLSGRGDKDASEIARLKGVAAKGSNVVQGSAFETRDVAAVYQFEMCSIRLFLLYHSFVKSRRETIDEINIAGELLMFFLGDTARHEDTQMTYRFVHHVDNCLLGGENILITLVQIEDPAQGLLWRSDVVSLGAQTNNG